MMYTANTCCKIDSYWAAIKSVTITRSTLKQKIKRRSFVLLASFVCCLLASLPVTGQTYTFIYSGGMQTWTVPAGVTSILVNAQGAIGGTSSIGGSSSSIGGNGGCVTATLAVTAGQVLNIFVGGRGTDATSSVGGTGGYNGGGNGETSGSYSGGGGGGGSDIRIGGTALTNRKVVAGGGGGGGFDFFVTNSEKGGAGGTLTGENGYYNSSSAGIQGGQGGMQLSGGNGGVYLSYPTGSGGTLGVGGDGGLTTSGGGGGGGYYGGGGGCWSGGGGGSSYTNPVVATSVTHTLGCNSSGDGVVTINIPCSPPTISSLSSSSGYPAASITLTGTNFDATTTNDIVYFGATKATVTAASTTSLTVNVPSDAIYWPVTVDNSSCNLVGYSQLSFLPTYNNSAYAPGSINFDPLVSFTGAGGSFDPAISDIDGDGKADMIVYDNVAAAISVYRNTSTSGVINSSSFASHVDFAESALDYKLTVGDLDGDGKPDIVGTYRSGASGVAVFRNTSTVGTINSGSFAAATTYTVTTRPVSVEIADIDIDGKPDLVVVNYTSNTIAILKNTSTVGSISFAAPVYFSTLSLGPVAVAVRDLDGDGKPDIAVGYNFSSTTSISVFLNTSTPGTISSASLAAGVTFGVSAIPERIAIGDMDGDGKADIITANTTSNSVSVLRNTSSVGSLSFATHVDFTTGAAPYSIGIGDFDGDSKPDIAVVNYPSGTVSVLRNTSTSGSITTSSFAPKIDFGGGSQTIAVGDLDGDGKADIVVPSLSAGVSVLRNDPQSPINGTLTVCAGSTTTLSNTASGGTWSSSNTSVATVGTSNGVVTGVSAGTSLISYTTTGGTVTATVTVMAAPANISGPTTVCPGTTITLSDATGSGTWGSINTSIATVTSGGVVTGVTAGYVVITYGTGSCYKSTLITVGNPIINTVAGGGGSLGDGGPATAAQMQNPTTTYIDGSGNKLIADFGGNRIRKVNTSGIISTIAGNGTAASGGDGSAATSASVTINNPAGVCEDPAGNIYIAEQNGCRVRKINTSGIISTFAGTGSCSTSGDGGAATLATINHPTNVVADASGNVYITDWNGARVRMVNSSGIISTIAGGGGSFGDGGPATAGLLNHPYGLSLDGQGNLFIGDEFNNRVRMVNLASGIISTVAGTGTSGFGGDGSAATAALLSSPDGVYADAYNVYIGDVNNQRVRVVNRSTGIITSIAGNGTGGFLGDGGAPATAELWVPAGVVLDASNNIYISDFNNSRLREVSAVNPTAVAAISGASSVCSGATTTLSDATAGGVWSSSNGSVATIGTGGVVTGVASGTTIISYTVAYACGNLYAIKIFSVNATSAISGPATVCVGSNVTLTDPDGAGTWISSNTSAATIGGGTGVAGGVGSGTSTITFTLTSTGCTATRIETVNALPSAILGANTVCPGLNTTLSDASGAGTWVSSNTSAATIGGGTGVVGGVAAGTTTITFTLTSTGCSVTRVETVTPNPAAISGSSSVCVGASVTLSDATGGGTWSSSNTSVATAGLFSGAVGGVATGTTTITYMLALTGCYSTMTETVNSSVSAISGTLSVCVGSNTALSDASGGGVWSSSTGAVATIGAGSGIAGGVTVGTSTITYSLGAGCLTTSVLTVNANPAAITPAGAVSVCAGATTSLTDATAGGAWSSSNSGVATVASGVVTGVAAGTATISYTTASGCSSTKVVTVNQAPAAITPGGAAVCVGSNLTLSDATGAGVWSSSNAGVATIGAGTGVAGGVAFGTTTISYTLGTCYATTTLSVDPVPGAITPAGPVTVCTGTATSLTDATGGGAWSSSDITIATVDASGNTWGVAAGAATITYSLGTGCYVVKNITVNTAPTAILPSPAVICTGATTTLTDGAGGGAWSSSNTAVATIDAVTGLAGGVTAGTSTITYAIGTCVATATLTVNMSPNAGSISGPASVCTGLMISLTDAASGGIWSSSNTSVATVDISGNVTGVSSGVTNIMYTVSNSCGTTTASAAVNVFALPVSGTITGASTVCAGTFTLYTESAPGGVWSVTNSNASITGTGLLTGIIPGTDTVVYSVSNSCGTASVTKVVSIGSFLTAGSISGSSSECVGATLTLSDAAPGGTWSASNSNATVSSGGVVTGMSGGADTIMYTVTASCGSAVAIHVVSVIAPPAASAIVGVSSICAGMTTTYTDAVSGGIWGTSNPTANINSAGLLTAITAGIDTVIYTVTNACGSVTDTKPVIIGSSISAGSISGPTSVCPGASITLTDATAGGTWSASNANATVSSGVVTGVTAGAVTISYTVTSSCGSVSATYSVTVNPAPAVGTISGPSLLCSGSTFSYTDAVAGGVWSMANGNATISGGGMATPVSAGADTVLYTVSNTWCTASATMPITVGITPTVGSISGAGNVCAGATVTLTDATAGGIWTSSNTSATVGSATGIVTGAVAGLDTIAYSISNACGTAVASKTITVNPVPFAGSIAGPASVCVGSFTIYVTSGSGGAWASSNASATITGAGVVSALSTGVDTISYTVVNSCGTAIATKTITITTGVSAGVISGPSNVCAGATITLSDATAGGVWSSSNATAAVGSGTGIVTGIVAGVDTVYYTVSGGCGAAVAMATVTINPLPAARAVSGGSDVCIGSAITLSDATAGGAWSSGAPSTASVSATGVVSGIATGVAVISYSVSNSCGTANATHTVTVESPPTAGIINGSSNVCIGSTTTLSDAVTGGVWSSSNARAAITVAGVVTGVSTGIDTISYTATNACGAATATKTISVIVAPDAGSISGASVVCAGRTIVLSDAATGGIWSASNGHAAVSGGVVTGITTGIDTIRYTVTAACGSVAAVKVITVSSAPSAGAIDGPASICPGETITLMDAAPGGSWGSSNSAIAMVNSSGVVTGVAAGIATINYTVSGACGNATAAHGVTVLPASECNTGVNAVTGQGDIRVLPNPNNGSFSVKGAVGTADEQVSMEVTDMLGQTVYKTQVKAANGIIDEQIRLSNSLANGVYMLNIRAQSGSKIFHVVIGR